jgi:ribosome-binding protein aMBF1 (putative translation factor)
MNFRDMLLAAGLSTDDLSEAVEQSRQVVRAVERGGELLQRAAVHVAEKSKSEKVKRAATIAGFAGAIASQKAGVLLGRGRR